MRILIVIHSLGCGGAERVTMRLAERWARMGWRVALATFADVDKDFYEAPPFIERHILDAGSASPSLAHGLVANLRRIAALRRLIRTWRPDTVVGVMATSAVLVALAGCGTGARLIGAERIHPPYAGIGRVWEFLRRHAYGLLDGVVALSGTGKIWLRAHTHSRQLVVIPNPVELPLPVVQPEITPQTFIDPDRRVILAVGRLNVQKGFDLLIAAFDRLAERFPIWDLVIVGEGPQRGALEAQRHALGRDERIHLPGRVGNIGAWYARADLFALSSRFEGFPNTLAEAMAHGLASVAFDCETGPRDIVRDGIDGVLVPSGDVAGLARALASLMGDDSPRAEMSVRAREVVAKFSMERVGVLWDGVVSGSV